MILLQVCSSQIMGAKWFRRVTINALLGRAGLTRVGDSDTGSIPVASIYLERSRQWQKI